MAGGFSRICMAYMVKMWSASWPPVHQVPGVAVWPIKVVAGVDLIPPEQRGVCCNLLPEN